MKQKHIGFEKNFNYFVALRNTHMFKEAVLCNTIVAEQRDRERESSKFMGSMLESFFL